MGLIPGSGRSPGGGHDKPLRYSCLEDPMDKGAWQATVHRVTKSQTQLKRLSMHSWCLINVCWKGGKKTRRKGGERRKIDKQTDMQEASPLHHRWRWMVVGVRWSQMVVLVSNQSFLPFKCSTDLS